MATPLRNVRIFVSNYECIRRTEQTMCADPFGITQPIA